MAAGRRATGFAGPNVACGRARYLRKFWQGWRISRHGWHDFARILKARAYGPCINSPLISATGGTGARMRKIHKSWLYPAEMF